MIAKNRKGRQNRTAFAGLIDTPAVGAVTLPAGARLALKSVASATAGTTAATIAGTSNRTIKTPALAAGESMTLDYVALLWLLRQLASRCCSISAWVASLRLEVHNGVRC